MNGHAPYRPGRIQSPYRAFIDKLGPEETVAYIDETYRPDNQFREPGFYTVIATICRKQDIEYYRHSLTRIVGESYWHSTEALRDGRTETFLNLLRFMHDDPSMTTIVTTTNVSGSNDKALRTARAEAMTELMTNLGQSEPMLRAYVIERQANNSDNNSDVQLFKTLQSSGHVPSGVALKIISPQEDHNLWLPDTAGMTYRRTITHKNHVSASWFGQYLAKWSHVTVLPEVH